MIQASTQILIFVGSEVGTISTHKEFLEVNVFGWLLGEVFFLCEPILIRFGVATAVFLGVGPSLSLDD